MADKKPADNDIFSRGFSALLRELGPSDYIQFLRHFTEGNFDYTRDRHTWLNEVDFKKALKELRAKRPAGRTAKQRKATHAR